MGTDKGENFEVESGPHAGLGDRGPIWLLIGILMVAGMVYGGYIYHASNVNTGPSLTLPASAGSRASDATPANHDNEQALPGGNVPAGTYGNTNNTGGSGSTSGQPSSSTY